MALYKDQAVGKMTDLLREVPPDIRDDVFVKAKNRLEEEARRVSRESLERLFDSQIQTLKDRGCPEVVLSILQNQRSEVISKASQMTFEQGHVPFLPVIPQTYLSIYTQMEMVRNGREAGYTYLEPADITDVVETPKRPYFIFDVEDGEVMRGKAPQDAEKAIKRQGRRGLTAVEVIALGIHADVLLRHYVDAVGSRYKSGRVPGLYLFDGGRPKLDWGYLSYGDSQWGAASCGSN